MKSTCLTFNDTTASSVHRATGVGEVGSDRRLSAFPLEVVDNDRRIVAQIARIPDVEIEVKDLPRLDGGLCRQPSRPTTDFHFGVVVAARIKIGIVGGQFFVAIFAHIAAARHDLLILSRFGVFGIARQHGRATAIFDGHLVISTTGGIRTRRKEGVIDRNGIARFVERYIAIGIDACDRFARFVGQERQEEIIEARTNIIRIFAREKAEVEAKALGILWRTHFDSR